MVYGTPRLETTEIRVLEDTVQLYINDQLVHVIACHGNIQKRWAHARIKVLRDMILDALGCNEEPIHDPTLR